MPKTRGTGLLMAWTDVDPRPNPEEVGGWRWLSWADYARWIEDPATDASYWARDQFAQLLYGYEGRTRRK